MTATALHESTSFTDDLMEWLDRSPFLAIAMLFHVLAFFAANIFPWEVLQEREEVRLTAVAPTVVEEPFEELVEHIPVPIEPTQVDSVTVAEVPVDPVVDSLEASDSPADATGADMPFDALMNSNDALGIGPGAAGSEGLGKRGRGLAGQPRAHAAAVRAALDWLAEHQSPEGYWDADGFASECGLDDDLCNGAGDSHHDIGVTSLALLAYLGAGESHLEGEYKQVLKRGLHWLQSQQDTESGEFEGLVGTERIYDQALGALALAEALRAKDDPLLARRAQLAVNCLLEARNPYAAWRYGMRPDGDNDTSITGWAILALSSAKDQGLDVPDNAFRGALAWVDEATNSTGVTGYNERGGVSSRVTGTAEYFPTDTGHAMTAAGVLTRAFCSKALGADEAAAERLVASAERLIERPPVWDDAGGGGGNSGWEEGDSGPTNDMYYWYYGAYALYQVSAIDSKYWRAWSRDFHDMLVDNQRTAPACYSGSWDPSGPWGNTGGRVYSTAMLALCLEVTYRYEQVFDTDPK